MRLQKQKLFQAVYGFSLILGFCHHLVPQIGVLSVLQPINSVSYVIAAVLGSIFFDEAITAGRAVGIAAIMAGVFLLARGEVEK